MKKMIRRLFAYLKKRIHASVTLRSLLYDSANVKQFSDLEYHEVMLADTARVDAYHKAIVEAVKPGDVVVDLGTGTGLLAMFAARQGAKRVYAIEHGDVIDVARTVAAANQLANIEFVRTNSRDFAGPELADLIVHEQIGSYLFDENMVENLLDLKRRVLKKSGKILPARFQLFVEPVALRADHRIPYCWESPIHGIDFSVLRSDEVALRQRKSRGRRLMANGAIDHYVCDPQPVVAFDLDTISESAEIPTSYRATRTVVRGGRVDGLSVFFKASLGNGLGFDNALDSPNTNWTNPMFRVPSRAVNDGDVLTVTVEMGSLSDPASWNVDLL